MPKVVARWDKNEADGHNIKDRSLFSLSFDPASMLKMHAPKFAALLEQTNNEGGRSAFSCAEADALSCLLMKLKWYAGTDGAHFADIEFGRATAEDGKELWHPCKNCSVWLEEKGGWGADKTYRLTATALEKFA